MNIEPWLLLGILGYLSYAVSTSTDKFFMNKGYDPVSTNTFKMFFDGVILLIIGFFFFNLNFNLKLVLWSLILGGIYAFAGILYFISLKLKDIKTVIPYYQSSTLLLIFTGSVILFDEAVNIYNYIGIALLLIGVYAVLSKDGFKFPKLDKVIFLIFMVVILDTVYSLLAKKLLFDIEPINLAIMMYFSSAIILACYLLLSKKQKKLFDVKSSRIVVSALFGAIGTFLIYSALSIGDASKVYPIAGLEVVFVFLIASIFLKEKFYWHRLIGTFLVFIGITFISL